ncbi:MAG: universal stress protein [bacterium]|nr:universal stress protein [bacterium]
MKKILVPIDFSDVTGKVIHNAVEMAKAFNAELKIIHVAPPVAYEVRNKIETQIMPGLGEMGGNVAGYISYDLARDQIASKLKLEHNKLLEIKDHVEKKNINTNTFLYEGKVLETILHQVEEYKPDILILGSHGHGYMHKVLLGSVAVAVIKSLKCPVMIIPAKENNNKENGQI